MKNKLIKIASGASVTTAGLYLMLANIASAQSAFGTSTASTIYNQFQTDVALIIGTVIGGLLALMGALIGLGWAQRKFKHYISGRKF